MISHDEPLPLNRSYVEQRIGQLVGIFQIDRARLSEHAEARALPSTDGMMGLVAVAKGGRLSETGFNVWTVGSQMFKETGCPSSNRVDFTLSDYARRLWGANGKSGSLRRRVAEAMTELLKTRVVVMGVDPYSLEPARDAVWELNLLEAAGARSELQSVFSAVRCNDRTAVAKLASLSWRAQDEKATWSMVLPKWLADNIRRGRGVILDYEVQRALRGSAKRIWVQLESYSGWRSHRLAPTENDEEFVGAVRSLTEPWGELTVEPADDEPAVDVETMALALGAEIYEAFGLMHANRKRDLEAACRSILATDRTYLRAEVCAVPRTKRRFELHVARAAGALRQERHRSAIRLRADQAASNPEEQVSASALVTTKLALAQTTLPLRRNA